MITNMLMIRKMNKLIKNTIDDNVGYFGELLEENYKNLYMTGNKQKAEIIFTKLLKEWHQEFAEQVGINLNEKNPIAGSIYKKVIKSPEKYGMSEIREILRGVGATPLIVLAICYYSYTGEYLDYDRVKSLDVYCNNELYKVQKKTEKKLKKEREEREKLTGKKERALYHDDNEDYDDDYDDDYDEDYEDDFNETD